MLRFPCLCLALCLIAFVNPADAQLGASPLDTLNFLGDLRARTGEHGPEPLASEERQAVDRGHELARPEMLSTIQTQMQLYQGDFTGYRGVYSTDWDYLSPWHDDVVAPNQMHETRGGLRWGASFEQSLEYNHYRVDPLAAFPFNRGDKEDFIPRNRLFLSAQNGSLEDGRWTLNLACGIAGTFTNNFAFTGLGNRLAFEILPGTALAYDVALGDFALTIYDRVSLRPVSFVYRYLPPSFQSFTQIFQNDLGAGVVWRDGGRLSAALNYNWSRSIDVDNVGFGERDLQSLSCDLRYQWSPKLTVGLEGSYAVVDPHDTTQNDGRLWQVGVFGEWLLAHDHQVRLAAGYQASDFEARPLLFAFGGFFPPVLVFYTNGDSNSPSGIFWNLRLAGRLTEHISHEFAAGYETAPAELTNATSAYFANYSITLVPWEDGRIVLSGYWEEADGSGGVYETQQTQSGGDFYLEQRLSPQWGVGGGYHFGYMDGDAVGLGSAALTGSQHALRIGASYAIAKGWTARLEWQDYFLSSQSTPVSDIRQDRIILAVRAEF